MNQYERIVSYIYQYKQEEKGANVGYAKVEKRGNKCRISVQMRTMPIKHIPTVYLYKQLSEGIQTIEAGQMIIRGNSMFWKDSCDADKLFASDWQIDDIDGIFVDGRDAIYFATSWKNDKFYRGNWKGSFPSVEETAQEKNIEQNNIVEQPEPADEPGKGTTVQDEMKASQEMQESFNHANVRETSEVLEEQERSEAQETLISAEPLEASAPQKVPAPADSLEGVETEELPGEKKTDDGQELQMQSICGVCPFKRKTFDYGKKILMTFPSMRPFQNGVARACVRMELQDIGCLPIASWSLSGNRFLLHGYYCYRHLLFAQLEDGRYVLGVPGIYSEKERRNAYKFGFSEFQSIGDFGMQQGVFGYWFLELPDGSPTHLG